MTRAPVRAVAFDLGETLLDETRYWGEWAARLGLTPLTLFAQLGAAIERGEHHRTLVRDVHDEAGEPLFGAEDLYPDARPAIAAAARAGLRVGVAGNFPEWVAEEVRGWGLGVHVVTSSAALGAEKPDAAFFVGLAKLLEVEPRELAYVGDRLDNDVAGARTAGCTGVLLRRGPWAAIQQRTSRAEGPAFDGLVEAVEWILAGCR